MFTGIIESTGIIENAEKKNSNLLISVRSDISNQLSIDESVSHNGVCLTIINVSDNIHQAEVVTETLQKSNLGALKKNDVINMERAMLLNSRLDGHLVQGHVDATALCISATTQNGSHNFRFQIPKQFSNLIIEKGSICIDGISLTIFDITDCEFSVTIIPYTFAHTTMQQMHTAKNVNIEFDIIGKYIARINRVKRTERKKEY